MGACSSRTDLPVQAESALTEGKRHSTRPNTSRMRKSSFTIPIEASRTDLEVPDVIRTEKQPYRLDEKIVYDFIWQYMDDFTAIAQDPSPECWKKFWERNHTKDYILIRPSGNPLNLEGLIDMFKSGDIVDYSESIVAVESIKILAGGAVATMVFKSEQIFRYKGNDEDDIATWTAVFVPDEENQQPRITNIHRAPGKPVNGVHSSSNAQTATPEAAPT